MIILNWDDVKKFELQLEKLFNDNPEYDWIPDRLKWISYFQKYEEKFIPSAFRDSWLESCDPRIIEWAKQEYESDLDTTKHGLYLYGPCGVGKTFALYALYRNMSLNTEDCEIKNVTELLRLFKKDFSKNTHSDDIDERSEFQKAMGPYHSKGTKSYFEKYLQYNGTLFIDDIGSERNTEFTEETLYDLINNRSENRKTTFFTSNLSLKELADKSGDRLASRIAGMCDVIELKGKDRRIKE